MNQAEAVVPVAVVLAAVVPAAVAPVAVAASGGDRAQTSYRLYGVAVKTTPWGSGLSLLPHLTMNYVSKTLVHYLYLLNPKKKAHNSI